jgi:hypothetical protein
MVALGQAYPVPASGCAVEPAGTGAGTGTGATWEETAGRERGRGGQEARRKRRRGGGGRTPDARPDRGFRLLERRAGGAHGPVADMSAFLMLRFSLGSTFFFNFRVSLKTHFLWNFYFLKEK